MNSLENKQILQAAFAELAVSNAKPFVDLMTDDFCWVCTGTTQWSRRYAGKQTVLDELFAPLRNPARADTAPASFPVAA